MPYCGDAEKAGGDGKSVMLSRGGSDPDIMSHSKPSRAWRLPRRGSAEGLRAVRKWIYPFIVRELCLGSVRIFGNGTAHDDSRGLGHLIFLQEAVQPVSLDLPIQGAL